MIGARSLIHLCFDVRKDKVRFNPNRLIIFMKTFFIYQILKK